jgi:hypothetical protein
MIQLKNDIFSNSPATSAIFEKHDCLYKKYPAFVNVYACFSVGAKESVSCKSIFLLFSAELCIYSGRKIGREFGRDLIGFQPLRCI